MYCVSSQDNKTPHREHFQNDRVRRLALSIPKSCNKTIQNCQNNHFRILWGKLTTGIQQIKKTFIKNKHKTKKKNTKLLLKKK